MPRYKRKYEPKLRKKGGRWYLRFYDSSSRRRRDFPLGTADTRIAKRYAAELTHRYYNDEFNPFEEEYEFGSLTLPKAVARYLKDRSELRPATLRSMKSLLGILVRTCPAGIAADHVSPKDIRKVIARCPSDAGKASYHRQLAAFFSHLDGKGLISTNPMKRVAKPRRADETYVFLRPEDLAPLLESQENDDMRRRVRFMIATGMRVGETCALRWKHVRRDAGRIYVQDGDGFSTKTGSHVVPLLTYTNDVLREVEKAHVGQFGETPPLNAFVFDPEHKDTVKHRFKRSVRAAGLSDEYNLKALRHTFASWAMIAGVDLRRVQRWMGHRSIKTTEKYAHLSEDYAVTMGVPAEIWAIFGEIVGTRYSESASGLRLIK